ncbi:MAG: VOC family protein [Syntrophorhabdales bacterium]|jgi:4-hydroxyphenylpyruvate dioxygenase-like putative hemolysin
MEFEGAVDRLAFLPIRDASIELISPGAETGFAADFLREKGEAIHHIAFEVEDLDAIFEELTSRGVVFLMTPAAFLYGRPLRCSCVP